METDDRVSVLLVDDQDENLLALETVLAGPGLKLVKASSGIQALKCLLDEDFAVALLDVRMPDIDGFETAALMRERDRSRNTPIIFITALSTAETHVSRGYSLGAVDYIFKPIVPEVLRAKVQVFAELFRKTRQVERLNESLRQRTRELEAANRDLESFSYSVSHDLRAPLRAIAGFADIISRRYRDALSEEARHYFDNIVEASERMGQLIEDLLAYARLGRQALRRRRVSLYELIAQIAADLAPRLAETGGQVSLSPNLPTVHGDPTLLGEIFTNLIGNALTYSRPGVPPQVSVTCEVGLDWVTVQVRDNGIGIPPEHQERIFEVFQRLQSESSHPGTGIGLAIARKSAAMMDGRVWVQSVVGEGSTFSVTLPRHAREMILAAREGREPWTDRVASS
ncbi:MAG: response regulator [Chloroflexi bacterium]|nr:response regulator [Chloroflexota bacterium]